jgi:4-hydroxy 2-oxovalerate aldolase
MTSIYDVTLRDGNHALRHTLESKFVEEYCKLAEQSDAWAIEVGHGNGLGASSYLVGQSVEKDENLLIAARNNLKNKKLAVHAIPGFATIDRDIKPAIEIGVDVFRIATHVTEASVAESHIEYLASRNKIVHGVLMMSHMIDIKGLLEQAKLFKSYGASAIIFMDSAGYFLPKDVSERVKVTQAELGISVGFHAHNNLGMATANSLSALTAGATIIDGASMGLGAGAGNAQLESIVAVRAKTDDSFGDVRNFAPQSRLVESNFHNFLPRTTMSSIDSGLAGVFSGYAPQVKQIATEMGIEIHELWQAMAERKLVPGQESMIREIAQDLMNL